MLRLDVSQPSRPPSPTRAGRDPDLLAPDGAEIRVLADAAHGATRASLCEVRLAAGGVSRPMRHRSVEEIWHVTSGQGRVWRCPPGADADPVDVREGDTLVVPVGWAFQFSASPGADLRFLCYTSPAWPGADEAEPVPSGPLGPATV